MSGTILLKSNQNRNQNQKLPAGTYLNPLGSSSLSIRCKAKVKYESLLYLKNFN